jgi:hypothetical protein
MGIDYFYSLSSPNYFYSYQRNGLTGLSIKRDIGGTSSLILDSLPLFESPNLNIKHLSKS